MDSKYCDEIFNDKDGVEYYIPKQFTDPSLKEMFVVELLDCIESYLYPLRFGVHKEDIKEYVQLTEESNLLDFLRYKRYVSTSEDIVELLAKYAVGCSVFDCFKVLIENTSQYSIETIRDIVASTIHEMDESKSLNESVSVEEGEYVCNSNNFIKR